MKSSVSIIVKGRVQGVGFRWFTINQAENYDIKGYVQNLKNGDVEVFAEGDDFQLIEFINKIKEGPSFSMVMDVITRYEKFKGQFKDFKLKY